MELYQKNKVNPLTPFLLLLLQLPVLFALYRIFVQGLTDDAFSLLYSFVPAPENFMQTFLGLIDLTKPYILLALVTAVGQYAQGRLAMMRIPNKGKGDQAEKIAKITTLVIPVVTVVILVRLPAAVALYWLTSTIFSIIQQIIVNRSDNDKEENDTGTTDKSTQNDRPNGV